MTEYMTNDKYAIVCACDSATVFLSSIDERLRYKPQIQTSYPADFFF